jgi:hypothetical protein
MIAKAGGFRLALDATRIYWTDSVAHVFATSPSRVEIDGGPGFDAGAIDVVVSSAPGAWGVAVDATSVYVAAAGGSAVIRVQQDGGSPATLASTKNPRELKLDANYIYYSYDDPYELGLRRIPYGIGEPLTYGGGYVVDFAVDAKNVYFTATGPNYVLKSPIDQAKPVIIDTPPPTAPPERITLDDKAIYYALGAGQDLGRVMKLAK